MNTEQPLFIAALPRSKTGWMAAWLSAGDTLCIHDLKYTRELMTIAGRRVGLSSPSAASQLAEIARDFPLAPWVVIIRDQRHAFNSWWKLALPLAREILKPLGAFNKAAEAKLKASWQDYRQAVDAATRHPTALVVGFDDLDKEEVARAVWKHIFPSIPFDVQRWKLFRTLNIQQRVSLVAPEIIRQHHPELAGNQN